MPIADAVLGQAIAAAIVTDGTTPLTANDVKRHCLTHLEDYMIPKAIEFRAELPKTGSGKILRREIQIGHTSVESSPSISSNLQASV